MEELFPEEQIVNSLIGPGSRFKGDLEVHGLIRIDGDFVGSVQSSGRILIGRQGRFDGTLSGRVLVVGGIFRGSLYAQSKVVILAGAIVIGNIHAPRMVMEESSIIDGYLLITGQGGHEARQRVSGETQLREKSGGLPAALSSKSRKLFGSRKSADTETL